MRAIPPSAGVLLREVALGAGLGMVLLGVGGRIAMRVVALAHDQPPVLSEGTLTVVTAGAAAGAVGALLHALARFVTRSWRGSGARLLRVMLFGALLALATARGLHGSPGPTWPFWLLVAAYAAAFDGMLARRARQVIKADDDADSADPSPVFLN